jgi:putative ubiquitin-RnfH superfamily antitoxin RatB of RatAB toxin-antitoxin module
VDVQTCAVGVFGKAVTKPEERVLNSGERIEIYRPLIADPKEIRKQRAVKSKAAKEG